MCLLWRPGSAEGSQFESYCCCQGSSWGVHVGLFHEAKPLIVIAIKANVEFWLFFILECYNNKGIFNFDWVELDP